MILRCTSFISPSLLVAVLALAGCSSDSGGSGTSPEGGLGAGEAPSTGSVSGSGGAASSGGSGQTGTGAGSTGKGSGGASSGGAGTSSNGGTTTGNGGATGTGGDVSGGGAASTGGRRGRGGATSTGGSATGTGGANTGGATGTGGSSAGSPSGWLHTKGNKIYLTTGSTDAVWMGRGVNVDDIFFCGYNSQLSMSTPDQTLETLISNLVSGWKPNFLRISLSMDSFGKTVSFVSSQTQYATPMIDVIKAIGTHPGVYVLVTLRSDASMIGQDTADGDPEATGVPSDSTTTPDKSKFPNGTDPVYQALVDSFANASYVMFGLTNEAGGNKLTDQKIAAAMTHAVGVIRAEEDKMGTPHHLVSVQGNSWTSNIGYYATNPLSADNVVYEVHGYPPATSSYTYSNIPVIIGEYGSLSNSDSFYADLESKQIPNLAWDFDSYSNCSPDLLNVNQSATNLMPTSWGNTVKSYLAAP